MAQREPTFDEQLEQLFEDTQSGGGVEESARPAESEVIDDEDDDEVLAAWLAERETELRERAFGLADQFDDDWRRPGFGG